MRKPLVIATLIGIILMPGLLHAVSLCTKYVATTGSDVSGCGTSSNPCATIAYVDANIVTAGSTVCVASGTYTGSFQTSKSGTASQRIRYISYPRQWGAQLVGNTTGDNTYTWRSNGNYVDIAGFDVTASSGTSPAIGIYNNGMYDQILGNRVHDFTTPCDANGGAGIDDAAASGGYSRFVGNFVHNIQPVGGQSCGSYSNTVGVYLQWPYSLATDNLIVNTPNGIQLYHDTFSELVINNTIRCPSSSGTTNIFGIYVGAGTGVSDDWTMVANNITDGCYWGIRENIPTGTGTDNDFLNNDDYNSNNPLTILGGGAQSGNITSNPLFVNDTGDYTGRLPLAIRESGNRHGCIVSICAVL